MGYILLERPLMRGESREHWYLERREELVRARDHNSKMLHSWLLVVVLLAAVVIGWWVR